MRWPQPPDFAAKGSFWRRATVQAAMLKRSILFDIDGTLVDSNDAHVAAWQRALAAEGFAFTWTQIHGQIGKGGDNLLPSLLPNASSETRERIEQAHANIYRRDFLRRVEPFPGAKEILRHLADRGHSLVLASSASRAEVDHYVVLLGADGLLSGTTCKDDVRHSKPCPDIFAEALRRSGSEAENAVVIGDAPYDVIASRKAGIAAIALLSGGFDEEELQACKPAAIYRDVAELDADYERSPLAIAPSLDAAVGT
jgi:HAD superfamily hydrolase (TIGR01509 family)